MTLARNAELAHNIQMLEYQLTSILREINAHDRDIKIALAKYDKIGNEEEKAAINEQLQPYLNEIKKIISEYDCFPIVIHEDECGSTRTEWQPTNYQSSDFSNKVTFGAQDLYINDIRLIENDSKLVIGLANTLKCVVKNGEHEEQREYNSISCTVPGVSEITARTVTINQKVFNIVSEPIFEPLSVANETLILRRLGSSGNYYSSFGAILNSPVIHLSNKKDYSSPLPCIKISPNPNATEGEPALVALC